MSKCRRCGWGKGCPRDLCCNPECSSRPAPTMRAKKFRAISATTKHGFHEPMVKRAA